MKGSTRYFLGLEKSRAINKTTRKLKLDDDTIITEPKDVTNEQTRYFKRLYTSKHDATNDVNNLFVYLSARNGTICRIYIYALY